MKRWIPAGVYTERNERAGMTQSGFVAALLAMTPHEHPATINSLTHYPFFNI
ncbi:MAG TPA: hypothetical protein VFA55_00250 [Candidatus Kapabacteria bacterium]|nr:hypothetical protein [Candidatus Kapabacteria bacterium]